MDSRALTIRSLRKPSKYQISIGPGRLSDCADLVGKALESPARKIVIVSNPKVYGFYGEQVKRDLKNHGFKPLVWLMKDGERHKNLRSAAECLRALSSFQLSRTDAVIGLGGGVVGDLAAFAASVYLRGVPYFAAPTTLLAMIDSSVGGKTAVNTDDGKNRIGTIAQPRGVIADTDTLRTLPAREITAGLCEAVKQAVLCGGPLFKTTSDFLSEYATGPTHRMTERSQFYENLTTFISAHISFKASIVSQDELEKPGRTDPKSRKILNFGHTFAHAIENLTNYRRFRHGEAVGHGIIFAGELSKTLEILDENELNLLYDVIHRVGRLPTLHDIHPRQIEKSFQYDKKRVADSIHWVLLKKIGTPVILSGSDVPNDAISTTLKRILEQ